MSIEQLTVRRIIEAVENGQIRLPTFQSEYKSSVAKNVDEILE